MHCVDVPPGLVGHKVGYRFDRPCGFDLSSRLAGWTPSVRYGVFARQVTSHGQSRREVASPRAVIRCRAVVLHVPID
jgi:hypothetical protein